MKKKLIFTDLVKTYFSFLLDHGFKYMDSPSGFFIEDVIGISDGRIEFIVGLDPRDKVVDVYLRKVDEGKTQRSYALFQYLVEKHGYRGGFSKVDLENPIEQQVVKQALLLKDNLNIILSGF